MTSVYAAVILAAGFSSRMQEFKPLMKIGNTTITDRVITLFKDAGTDVILVTGWRQDELVAGIQRKDITVAENPLFETGMLSSVQAGVRNLKPNHKAFLMMPVDIPLVRPATLKRLLAFADDNPGKIIYPSFNGKRGHPPFIPASLVQEITGWEGEGGLNAILADHTDIRVEFPVADENVLRDADRKEDFSRLIERFEIIDIPSEAECTAALDIAGTPENVRKHCRKVAEVALKLAEVLSNAGVPVNLDEVRAGAVLHDIARVMPNHGAEGAKMVAGHGFPRIGEIISIHQNLVENTDSVDIETKLVYLADKMVIDETVVTVEERYRAAAEKYKDVPEVTAKIGNMVQRGVYIRAEMEELMGCSVDSVIKRFS